MVVSQHKIDVSGQNINYLINFKNEDNDVLISYNLN